jgi:DNA-binding MarR family transcriptional regulator
MSENKNLPVMSRLGVIFLTWRRYLQKDLLPYGITLKQIYLLRQLAVKEYLYPAEIADILFCDRPTATVVIKNMKRYGWIAQERDYENAKRFRITITPAGRDKLRSISSSKPGDVFDPLSCFTPDELNQFETLLKKLSKHINTLK